MIGLNGCIDFSAQEHVVLLFFEVGFGDHFDGILFLGRIFSEVYFSEASFTQILNELVSLDCLVEVDIRFRHHGLIKIN